MLTRIQSQPGRLRPGRLALSLGICALTLSGALGLNGCAALNPENSVDTETAADMGFKVTAHLTPEVRITLPPPQKMEFALQQMLTAHYGDAEEQSVIVMLEHQADPALLRLAVLSPLNIRLLQAEYRSTGLDITKLPALPDTLEPSQVLCDILLCFYPVTAFKLPQGFSLSENEAERRLTAPDGTIVYRIEYEDMDGTRLPLQLTHGVFNYSINFEYF